ncbi:hypothetical protein [Clostridium botulinum]|uniref:hypothetical protein n=1 Tax=Clostridium botulinum TaxID=1491 RepID=UPI001C9B3D8B|nr:hypothetical protein [Clostridium botulinum]MBY6860785.1 hypothetical protein [Clostridium botulinum]MBY7043826.1 hypothetical protein [Clostridium botulinum]
MTFESTELLKYATKGIQADMDNCMVKIKRAEKYLSNRRKGISDKCPKTEEELINIINSYTDKFNKLSDMKDGLNWSIEIGDLKLI